MYNYQLCIHGLLNLLFYIFVTTEPHFLRECWSLSVLDVSISESLRYYCIIVRNLEVRYRHTILTKNPYFDLIFLLRRDSVRKICHGFFLRARSALLVISAYYAFSISCTRALKQTSFVFLIILFIFIKNSLSRSYNV